MTIELSLHRFLESTDDDSSELVEPNDTEVLRNTLKLYGSIFLVLMVIFCLARVRFQRVFNVRSWAPLVESDLARTLSFGYIDWVWGVWFISNDEFRDNCGLDALCYIRVLRLGFRLACVGTVNSIWLFPVYKTAEYSEETAHITDELVQVTVTNVPPGSSRFMATVLASYIFFGCTMYLLLSEFRWFTKNRHHFLSRVAARNYTIYVRHIPQEFQASGNLLYFFRQIFSKEAVLEAHVALKIPLLDRKIAQRDAVLSKLEHAIAQKNITGVRPTHMSTIVVGEQLDSIDTFTRELEEVNFSISEAVTKYERARRPDLICSSPKSMARNSRHLSLGSANSGERPLSFVSAKSTFEGDEQGLPFELPGNREAPPDPLAIETIRTESRAESTQLAPGPRPIARSSARIGAESPRASADPNATGAHEPLLASPEKSQGLGKKVMNAINKVNSTVKSTASSTVDNAVKLSVSVAGDVTQSVAGILSKEEEGSSHDAGFVTFTKLSSVQGALQMVQHDHPFVMDIEPAPEPKEIYWHNVGKPVRGEHTGKLLSLCLTVLLCLFWTVPVSFIASLTSVDALKGSIPFLAKWVEAAPWLDPFLAQVAPLALLTLNTLILPQILKAIARFELPVAEAALEASCFTKMAAFVIIQTFFVSAISGSILAELTNMIANPGSIVDLLANSLPGQSTYFIQLVLVSTFLGLSAELLRAVPIFQAVVRSRIGYNLTEKERNQVTAGMRPLADPFHFQSARVFAGDMLYFMVLFVYNSMAPMVNWFVAICFLLMGSGYRYQYLFNYPKTPDSGGQLWMSFLGVAQTCMMIAQVTIMGFLALRKATLALPFMFPLLAITVLFNIFVRQRHFWIAQYLPARDCLQKDTENSEEGLDFGSFRDEYLQPSLKVKEVLPDMASPSG